VNPVVLSGTDTIVPSGTRSSCYRGPKSVESVSASGACCAHNFSNLDSFGILLTPLSCFARQRRAMSRNGREAKKPSPASSAYTPRLTIDFASRPRRNFPPATLRRGPIAIVEQRIPLHKSPPNANGGTS